MATQPNSGPGRPIIEVSRSHTIRHTHTHTHTHDVGLLRTSDQPVAEDATDTTHSKYKRRISMLPAGFEPAIPAVKQMQNYNFDCRATGIGNVMIQQ